MIFLDTNILLYLVDQTAQNRPKQLIAEQLVRRSDVVLSAQVLVEFCNNAFKPKDKRNLLPQSVVLKLLKSWTRFKIIPISAELVAAAVQSKERFKISHLDALILEAARSAGCQQVYTEDLSHKQNYDGVQVINPFKEGN